MKNTVLKGKLLVVGLTILVPQLAWAQPDKSIESKRPTDFMDAIRQAEVVRKKLFTDPLSGIVINRTVTVQGHEFYRYFANRWRELSGESDFTLTVFERPSARWGSEMWVEYRNQKMYHAFLSPARSSTKKASEQAVDLVLENIQQNELERVLTNNPDLAPEEF